MTQQEQEQARRNFVTKSAQRITQSLVRGLSVLHLPSKTSAMVALETVSMVVGIVDGFACLAGVSASDRERVRRQFTQSGRSAAVTLAASGGNDVTPLRRELDHPEPTVDGAYATQLLVAAALSVGGCLRVHPKAIEDVHVGVLTQMPVRLEVSRDPHGMTHVHAKRSAWLRMHQTSGGVA